MVASSVASASIGDQSGLVLTGRHAASQKRQLSRSMLTHTSTPRQNRVGHSDSAISTPEQMIWINNEEMQPTS
jgi:hypothetical protein